MEEKINPTISYIPGIEKKIVERYGIYENESHFNLTIPVYVSITKTDRFIIVETDDVYRINNDSCNVTIWKNCDRMHITTF